MQNHNIGNAGEFYVLAQLAQRGYIAGKTDDGQTLIDIIATEPKTLRAVNIQVKTTKDKTADWLMSKKNEQHFETLWYVLVHLHGEECIPDFYIFHSNHIGPWLKNDHQGWLDKPKRNGEPRKDGNLRHFRPTEDELSEAKNKWNEMFADHRLSPSISRQNIHHPVSNGGVFIGDLTKYPNGLEQVSEYPPNG